MSRGYVLAEAEGLAGIPRAGALPVAFEVVVIEEQHPPGTDGNHDEEDRGGDEGGSAGTAAGATACYHEVQRRRPGPLRIVAAVALMAYGVLYLIQIIESLTRSNWSAGMGISASLITIGMSLLPAVLICAVFLRFGVGMVRGFELRLDEEELVLHRSALQERRIPREEIVGAERASCHPGVDAGSWGIRGGPGVRLHLRQGEPVLIATKYPDRLLAALGALS